MSRTLWGFPRVDPSRISFAFGPPWSTWIIVSEEHLSCSEWVSESCSVLSYSLQPHGLFSPWNFTEQNTGVGSLSLLQGIFPTQGSTQVSRIADRFFPAEPPGKLYSYQNPHRTGGINYLTAGACSPRPWGLIMLTPVTPPCYLAINQSESCPRADRVPPLPGEEGPFPPMPRNLSLKVSSCKCSGFWSFSSPRLFLLQETLHFPSGQPKSKIGFSWQTPSLVW